MIINSFINFYGLEDNKYNFHTHISAYIDNILVSDTIIIIKILIYQ